MTLRAAMLGLAIASATVPAFAAGCLTFDTAATLQGKVAAAEDYWVLRVSSAICVELPPGDDLGVPAYNVEEVQLVFKDESAAKKLAGQTVAVTGHLSPPHGIANKRPVVLEVETAKKK